MRPHRFLLILALIAAAAAARPAASTMTPVSRGDLRWLGRVTFGVNAAVVTRFQQLGREKFLDEQLNAPLTDTPVVTTALSTFAAKAHSAEARVKAMRAEQQRINTLANDDEKQKARMALNQAGNQMVYETSRRHLLRAIESTSQLREQMTWFWMNHFSVFSGKANVRWTTAEYEDTVRAKAFGRFSDLVLATALSPAMLEYLDNAQSAANKINENYARELMELHTLGVSGGASGSTYTQQDVQELSRVLTGAGLNFTDATPRQAPERQKLYVRQGLFEFNPQRHDFGQKTVLGHTIRGTGLDEIRDAVDFLCEQPATARFITRKLATYFISDEPSAALVTRMANTFQKTHGDIAAVLRVMFLDKDVIAAFDAPVSRADKFKDPMQFVVSSLRLAYDGKPLINVRPIVGWLQQLGEPLYGHVTPDGYPLTEPAWTSSGQLVKRFEIARAIGSGNAGLFNLDDNTPGPAIGFPMLNSHFYYETIEPTLGTRTRDALGRTASQQEWNTVLLSSPDWMMR